MFQIRIRWIAFSLILLVMGCSSSEHLKGRVPVSPVSGTISFKGNPVEGAIVNFVSEDGNPVATGKTDSTGTYSLTTYDADDGAGLGEYVVLVTKIKVPQKTPEGAEDSGYPGAKNLSQHLLPEQYSNRLKSPLRATVTDESSSKDFDFELTP
ncbi:hypothetical protein [Gimesia chilikensis]|uniref:Carboxypeptidase regulatory-like domain-containing protein n=1 Tax=Gimesia chilikensis TaxID=2605989 RepID=A0A517PQC2_9PLAN|nr:hypothetical protein [Gimesia chilikensis]QDT21577.1 hypothetical protein HG66A1_33800 [Gimesia chilikensis]